MKFRNGFVSNSSSSSFLVVFPQKPKSPDDIKKWLFPEKKLYGCISKGYLTSELISEKIFYIIQENNTKLNIQEQKMIELVKPSLLKQYGTLDSFWFVFNFSDKDDIIEADLEHSDIFGLVPHVRISHHKGR